MNNNPQQPLRLGDNEAKTANRTGSSLMHNLQNSRNRAQTSGNAAHRQMFTNFNPAMVNNPSFRVIPNTQQPPNTSQMRSNMAFMPSIAPQNANYFILPSQAMHNQIFNNAIPIPRSMFQMNAPVMNRNTNTPTTSNTSNTKPTNQPIFIQPMFNPSNALNLNTNPSLNLSMNPLLNDMSLNMHPMHANPNFNTNQTLNLIPMNIRNQSSVNNFVFHPSLNPNFMNRQQQMQNFGPLQLRNIAMNIQNIPVPAQMLSSNNNFLSPMMMNINHNFTPKAAVKTEDIEMIEEKTPTNTIDDESENDPPAIAVPISAPDESSYDSISVPLATDDPVIGNKRTISQMMENTNIDEKRMKLNSRVMKNRHKYYQSFNVPLHMRRNRKLMNAKEAEYELKKKQKVSNLLQAIMDDEKSLAIVIKKSRKQCLSNLEIDKILHRKKVTNNLNDISYEYYIQWKYLSYIHCEWISEELLLQHRSGNSKLKRFLKKYGYSFFYEKGQILLDPALTTVDRIIACRPGPYFTCTNDVFYSSEDSDFFSDPNQKKQKHRNDQRLEYLVKFNGLNYSECRWEFAKDIDDDQSILQFQKCNQFNIKRVCDQRPAMDEFTVDEQNVFKNDNKLHKWQIEGVNWLMFNWFNKRGSILADEMGLGKTVQVCATLCKISHLYAQGPFLVIVPLSTIAHWKRELEAWTDLNVVVFQGGKEDRRICSFYDFHFWDKNGERIIDEHETHYKFDVLVCTYESVMMLDSEISSIKWRVCIVDEAHRLKNSDSKLCKFLRIYMNKNIEHYILLTGTPIQNCMRELFNILQFADHEAKNPLFKSYEVFGEKFDDNKIVNSEQVSKLRIILQPYFLRRLKKDVAKFIPKKMETIIEVELTRIQKQYYKAVYSRNRHILESCALFANTGNGSSTKYIPRLMNVANDLRKICNHPYLMHGAYEQITKNCTTLDEKIQLLINTSGKFVLLNKLLPKLKADGHKILLFSQWTMTLDWIEDYLNLKNFKYERIDGQITGNRRQRVIDRFCRPDSDSFIFLLSTKSGGIGLNLMVADTIIIFDSDWNPQNDIQAMARCHRIGQKKNVVAYRLITSGTYEQEMFQRASKKLGLGKVIMQSMVDNNYKEKSVQSDISSESLKYKNYEINQLLKYGAYHVFGDDDKKCDEFCEATIEDILSHRTKNIVFDDENDNAFSKATFIASDAGAGIDFNSEDFWEQILPKQMTPQMLMDKLLISPDAKNEDTANTNSTDIPSIEDMEEFWLNVEQQALKIINNKENSAEDTNTDDGKHTLLMSKLLYEISNTNPGNLFTDVQIAKAKEWYQAIQMAQCPKHYYLRIPKVTNDESKVERKKKSDKSLRIPKKENSNSLPVKRGRGGPGKRRRRPKISSIEVPNNVYGTRAFNKKEVKTLLHLFFDSFATINANIFATLKSQFNRVFHNIFNRKRLNAEQPRKLREICGWCYGFLSYLVKKCAMDDVHTHTKSSPRQMKHRMNYNPSVPGSNSVLQDVRQHIRRMFPKELFGDEDADIRTNNLKIIGLSKRARRRLNKHPKYATEKDFPSLNKHWFFAIVDDNISQWIKRLQLSLMIRDRLKNTRNIRNDLQNMPPEIGGDMPCSWWDSLCDEQLIIGCGIHGIGNWNKIRQDSTLVFMNRCLTPSTKTTSYKIKDDEYTANDDEYNDTNTVDNTTVTDDSSVTTIVPPKAYQCCGLFRKKELMLHCDGCEEVYHAECCDIQEIPDMWFCFQCNGNWPSSSLLYARLRIILNAMKEHAMIRRRVHFRKSPIKNEDGDESAARRKRSRNTYARRRTSKRKIRVNNTRTQLGRLWTFSLKEMHYIQRCIQTHGFVSYALLKSASKSPKTLKQIKSYYFSLMCNVEYLVRCARLKELLAFQLIPLPPGLKEKFATPTMRSGRKNRKRASANAPEFYPQMNIHPNSMYGGTHMMYGGGYNDDIYGDVIKMSEDDNEENLDLGYFHTYGQNKNIDKTVAIPSAIPNPDFTQSVKTEIKTEEKETEDEMNDYEYDPLLMSNVIRQKCLDVIAQLISDPSLSSHFVIPDENETNSELNLNSIENKILDNFYISPQEMFDDIKLMTDEKLKQTLDANMLTEITDQSNKISMISKMYTRNILNAYAKEQEEQKEMEEYDDDEYIPDVADIEEKTNKIEHKLPPPVSYNLPPPVIYPGMYTDNTHYNPNFYDPNYNVHHARAHAPVEIHGDYRVRKTDLDMLTGSDIDKYFGIEKPDSIVNHQLTTALSNKIWYKVQMWKHLRKVENLMQSAPQLYANLFNCVKAQRNEIGIVSGLPEWWLPSIHDRMIIDLLLKYGMVNDLNVFFADEDIYQPHVSNADHQLFFEQFLIPRKPLINRVRYVCFVLTNNGNEPHSDIWSFNTLDELQSEFEFNCLQSRAEYQQEMRQWFKDNNIEVNYDDVHFSVGHSTNNAGNVRAQMSFNMGLPGGKSPKRSGKWTELLVRYQSLTRDENNDVVFPVQARQGSTILQLGTIVFDRKHFSSGKYIWPVGFESQRMHSSYLQPQQRVVYTSQIVDGGQRPKFVVIASDDSDNPIIATSSSTAWTRVIEKVNDCKPANQKRKTCTVSGPEMFGYNDPLVVSLIEKIPNAEKCERYWKNRKPFEETLKELMMACGQ